MQHAKPDRESSRAGRIMQKQSCPGRAHPEFRSNAGCMAPHQRHNFISSPVAVAMSLRAEPPVVFETRWLAPHLSSLSLLFSAR